MIHSQDEVDRCREAFLGAYRARHEFPTDRLPGVWSELEHKLEAGAAPRFDDAPDLARRRSGRRALGLSVVMLAAGLVTWNWSIVAERASIAANPHPVQAGFDAEPAALESVVARERLARARAVAGALPGPRVSPMPVAPIVGPAVVNMPRANSPGARAVAAGGTHGSRPPVDDVGIAQTAVPSHAEAADERVDGLLGEELKLLRQAQLALNRAAPAAAVRALQTHEEKFPEGALAPERQALRAIALCGIDPERGRAAASRFIAAYPSSTLRKRVRATCLAANDASD